MASKLLKLSSLLLFLSTVSCFTTVPSTSHRTHPMRPLYALSPEHLHELASNIHQHSHFFSSNLLADAAEAAVVDDGGWWQTYLNIFKVTLKAVHDTIDAPLRSIGFDQTWGVSIALFTAMARGVLVPLSIQQTRSAEYMKVLKPYVAEIKTKFKNDQNAQNQAVAKLYEDANQNPLAGCVTSLLQLPIILGLYRGVRLLALDGELQEPFLWIPSLQGPTSPPDYRDLDWLTQNWQPALDSGLPSPSLGWETTLAYLAMPVILVMLQSLTMKALQPPMDDNISDEEKETLEKSQGVLRFLPLMIGFFSLQVPAGLTIYWFTSNIFTLAQSLAVRAYFAANPPEIKLPEYWERALGDDMDFSLMSPEEKRAAAEAGIRLGPSMDDLKEEAMFHTFIERTPLRFDSETWKRVEAGYSKVSIPPELQEWARKGEHVNGAAQAQTSAQQQKQPVDNAFFVENKN